MTKHSVQIAVYYDKTQHANCCLLWQNTVGKLLFTMTKHSVQIVVYYDKTQRANCCVLLLTGMVHYDACRWFCCSLAWFTMMHAGGSIAPRHSSWWCIVHYDAMQALTQVVRLLLAMVDHFMMMRGSLWCNTGINTGGSIAGRHGSLWCASLHWADHDEAVCLLHHLDLAAGGRSWHVQHGALPTTQQATGPSDQVRPVDIVGSHWFLVWSGETGGCCWISLIWPLIRWGRGMLLTGDWGVWMYVFLRRCNWVCACVCRWAHVCVCVCVHRLTFLIESNRLTFLIESNQKLTLMIRWTLALACLIRAVIDWRSWQDDCGAVSDKP